MIFADHLTLDAPRARTSAGYLPVRARAAKTGVYQYSGREVDPDNAHGLRDTAIVNVLRDEATVFDQSAVRTFIGKPITIDHPSVPVTSQNWKDHARGTVMGALRDGDHIAFDLLLMDEAAIADVRAGKVQVSNGYSASLDFGDFTAPDGTKCPVRQARISDGNHVAIVDAARGGATCRIADAAHCDSLPQSLFDSLTQEKPVMKTMLIDGLTVDVSNADTALATINTILAARDAANGKIVTLEAKAVTDVATIVAKDAEIVKLTADIAATKITPQQMRDAAKTYALVVAKAKSAGVTVTDEMDEGAVMKAVVDKAMPGNTYTGDHVAIAFAALTKDAKVERTTDVLRDGAGAVVDLDDAAAAAETARQTMIADMLKPTTVAA